MAFLAMKLRCDDRRPALGDPPVTVRPALFAHTIVTPSSETLHLVASVAVTDGQLARPSRWVQLPEIRASSQSLHGTSQSAREEN